MGQMAQFSLGQSCSAQTRKKAEEISQIASTINASILIPRRFLIAISPFPRDICPIHYSICAASINGHFKNNM